MPKNSKMSVSASGRAIKAQHDDSQAHPDSENRSSQSVTPTSERVIKETSVKRREAMKVLANR